MQKYVNKEQFIESERQKREMEYYNEFSENINIDSIVFDPINPKQDRPWNSYWYLYKIALKHYQENKNYLLDFGCGRGISSIIFASIGYKVYGFDISKKSLNIGKKLAEKYGLGKRIDFTLQIAEKLNYPSSFFDIIAGFDILHHVDLKKAIGECWRVLKNGGIAIFREPVEVPLIDAIRNTRIVKKYLPNEKCMEISRHITQDERKLNRKDMEIIRTIFKNCVVEKKFTFLSRFDFLFNKCYRFKYSPLEIIDYYIFKIIPLVKVFGGDSVIILKKL
jgi:2-polyprenyl-3-methyl-5-hydroxy-6-metoxy-1,4-benzoquinol methylase